MNAVSGIYIITCVITGKSYIGKTKGIIKARVMYHLNGNTHGCVALHSAIQKYGKENFVWETLHKNVIPELLSVFEMEAIKTYNTISPNGYNLTAGGETGFQSEETIRKRTEKLKANPPMKGKKHTPESCRLMSESRTGLKRSDKTRKKMSEAAMGHEVSDETKQKISKANTGRKWSVEARQKMSKRNSGEGNPMYGKKRPAGEKAANASPSMKPAYDFFYSLPYDMPLQKKRELLYAEFSDVVHRKTIKNWVLKWIRQPYLATGEPNPLF